MAETIKNNQIQVSSPVFAEGGAIPAEYTCEGQNINPPLIAKFFPPETKTLAVLIEDPDAVSGTFIHWMVWGLPPRDLIEENTAEGVSGKNGFGQWGYSGPCPPSGTHRYFFKVWALEVKPNWPPDITLNDFNREIDRHAIAYGEMMGTYSRDKT